MAFLMDGLDLNKNGKITEEELANILLIQNQDEPLETFD